MKHVVFSVFDAKSHTYSHPIFFQNKAVAIRSFGDMCNEKGHQFNQWPEDFTLFEIGEYDDATGIFSPLESFYPVGRAIEFKQVDLSPPTDLSRIEELQDKIFSVLQSMNVSLNREFSRPVTIPTNSEIRVVPKKGFFSRKSAN